MTTKLGVHVNGVGHRKDYGLIVEQAPAVVLAIGDDGALLEAKQKSDGKTVTIFRQTRPFLDAPENFNQLPLDNPAEFDAAARKIWDGLKREYLSKPKREDGSFWFDYVQPTNELPATNQTDSVRRVVALEMKFMEFCEAENLPFRLAVGSPAGGSPTIEEWKEHMVPLIKRAGEGGHIYSRHAYGGWPPSDEAEGARHGPLTKEGPLSISATDKDPSADPNAINNEKRPFWEAEYLRSRGIHTPMVITEAGQNAGYRFDGTDLLVQDMARFDQLCMQHSNIMGFCIWTLGKFDARPRSNIQQASKALAEYLRNKHQQLAVEAQVEMMSANGESAHQAKFSQGYLWQGGLDLNGDRAVLNRPLDLRSKPSTKPSSKVLKRLEAGTVVEIDRLIDKPPYYYPVLVKQVELFSQIEPIPEAELAATEFGMLEAASTGMAAVGLHSSADGGNGIGWQNSSVRDEYRALQPGVIKFMTNQTNSDMVRTIVADHATTTETWIVRAFLHWGNRNLTPQDFVSATLNDCEQMVNLLRSHGIQDHNIIIELHNEPNLKLEGFSDSWNNGWEFVEFFGQVLDQYRPKFPHAKFGLGALSPGGQIGEGEGLVRYDSYHFLNEMMSHPRWNNFQVHLVHVYTKSNWLPASDIGWVDHCRRKTPGMPMWITEASWHTDPNTSGKDYAKKLVDLLKLLDARGVKGVTFYCVSASNPAFYHEVWCRGSNPNRPDEHVGSRGIAAEIRRLRPQFTPVAAQAVELATANN